MRKIMEQTKVSPPPEEEIEFDRTEAPAPHDQLSSESDSTHHEALITERIRSRAASTFSARTAESAAQRVPTYEGNPYDVDRVHTRDSFK